LLISIEGLDQGTVTNATIFDDWTVKDIMGHLVSWGDELRSEIREILLDPTPAYGYVISSDKDFEEWNQNRAAAKRPLSMPEILDSLDRDYQESADLIRRLAPDELQRRGVVPWSLGPLPPPEVITLETSMSVAALIETHIQHITEHSEDIRRWRSPA
jgi:hypothetical protein